MASAIEDGKYYYIINARTMTSLNVLDNGGPGTAVVGAISNFYAQPANSVWLAQAQGNSNWKFRNLATNGYMWFPAASAYSPLQSSNETASANQVWNLETNVKSSSPALFNIKNKETGLYIDLANGNSANNASVVSQQGSGPDHPNQCWCFIPTFAKV